jgi:hypothetical protein
MNFERERSRLFDSPDYHPLGSPHDILPHGWVGEGKLSKFTPAVLMFIGEFSGLKELQPTHVKDLAAQIQRFEAVPMPLEVVIESYAMLPANEIIARKEVFVPKKDDNGNLPEDFPHVDGCLDRALVLATCLRALKVPAAFTRKGTHSSVRFKLGENLYEIGHEPNPDFFNELRILRKEDLSKSAGLAKKGLYREGLDPADIGMNCILDFYICAPSPPAHIAPFIVRYASLIRDARLLG